MTSAHGPRPARLVTSMLAALVSAFAIASPADAQDVVRVPGTRVSIVVPPGFEPAAQFPGFGQADTGSSIVVTEMPAPFGAVRAGMSEASMASRGMTLLSSEDARIASRDGVLLSAAQQANGSTFRSWLGMFDTGRGTVLVVAAYPEATAATLGDVLKRAVLSARWDDHVVIDSFEGLRFRLRETATLKIAARVSDALLLTKGGAPGPVAPLEPLLVVGASMRDIQIDDVEAFARARILQTARVRDIGDVRGATVNAGDAPGYELVATARDADSGSPLVLYQVVAVRGRSYYLVQGMVGAAGADEFVSEFRAVVSSLSFVD